MMPDYHRQGLWKEWLSVISKEVTINNQVGLHARPATFFIQKANEFKSSIWIEREERRVNAKSLLGVLSLGIVKGTAVNIVADGVDENEAIATLSELIDSDFSECASHQSNGGGGFAARPRFCRLVT